MLGENEVGVTDGGIVEWQTITQERFNSKQLEIEQLDVYAKNLEESSHRPHWR